MVPAAFFGVGANLVAPAPESRTPRAKVPRNQGRAKFLFFVGGKRACDKSCQWLSVKSTDTRISCPCIHARPSKKTNLKLRSKKKQIWTSGFASESRTKFLPSSLSFLHGHVSLARLHSLEKSHKNNTFQAKTNRAQKNNQKSIQKYSIGCPAFPPLNFHPN